MFTVCDPPDLPAWTILSASLCRQAALYLLNLYGYAAKLCQRMKNELETVCVRFAALTAPE